MAVAKICRMVSRTLFCRLSDIPATSDMTLRMCTGRTSRSSMPPSTWRTWLLYALRYICTVAWRRSAL